MHELSIAQNIVNIALDNLPESDHTTINKIYCTIGSLTGIEISSLEFCFPFVVKGTAAADAALIITEEPAKGTCPQCQQRFKVYDLLDPCPNCDHWPLQLEGGRDMLLTSIELKEESTSNTNG